jgi:hypothetical protein
MARGWRRGRTRRGRRAGCLLWVVILLVVLVVLSLLFGGFQMGTKAGGDGCPRTQAGDRQPAAPGQLTVTAAGVTGENRGLRC